MTYKRFTCPRTCPLAGEQECRFNPVLLGFGPQARADSHTVRVKVEYNDLDAFQAAVRALGGVWLGPGTHQMFDGAYEGHGFRLPNWRYPCVLVGGELLHDHYNGAWGNPADLAKLKDEYVLSLAERRARTLGWLYERSPGRVVIYHPTGGTLTVTPDGTVDAECFVGKGCHEAIEELGLGQWLESMAKPEYQLERLRAFERDE